jgi:hypothetical protein
MPLAFPTLYGATALPDPAPETPVAPVPDRIGIALGFNSAVAVEVDADATDPGTAGARGGPGQDYVPVTGLGGVPGRLVAKKGRPPVPAAGGPDVTRWWRFLTLTPLDLDERHRLVYADAHAAGRVRHLYVVGQSCDAHQMGAFWWVDVVEYAL